MHISTLPKIDKDDEDIKLELVESSLILPSKHDAIKMYDYTYYTDSCDSYSKEAMKQ